MKKIITNIFVTLGVIFSLILLFVLYLFIFDPYNLKPLFFNSGEVFESSQDTSVDNQDGDANTTESKPFLSDAQKKALSSFGIDPASLPSTITPTQETCIKAKLGATRFVEISAGASPSISEFLNAKACL